MPRPEDYDMLDPDEIRDRLVLAETACVLFGWSTGWPEGITGDAVHQAWSEWVATVGLNYCEPKRHPDLSEKRIHDLAKERRRVSDETLKRIEEGKWAH